MGKALLQFAEQLRTEPQATAEPAAAEDASPDRSKLGATQTRVLEVVSAAGADGLTSGAVAAQANVAPTNAPGILKRLARRGLVEPSDTSPVVWRASPSSG